ncbi:MAG: sugar transferase [Acidobacteria bacterium]|nr:MAG: sugar transferase [Acidobacteriota bacterium]
MTSSLLHRIQLKRAFDLTFSIAGLLAVLPLMIVIAAAIWASDRGPVLFTQERVGWRRRTFRMLKFRTMVMDAEHATGPIWSWDGDPRVRRVGRILRATHLDELPQLWNVLRGEMSFVGPRPERAVFVEQLEQVIPGYTHRLAIRPGITGLSQLRNGYDESLRTVQRKIRYDLLYVRRGCTLLDAMIVLDTILLAFGLSGGLALRKVAVNATPRRRTSSAGRSLRFDHAELR